MKVLNFEVHNVCGVKDVKLDMSGRHLVLVGGVNGQGKTSALWALLMALCGRQKYTFPDVPLREGADDGYVRINLSGDAELHDDVGFNVELKFEKGSGGRVIESCKLTESTGDENGSPRQFLRDLYNFRGFNPLEFDRMDKKGRREMLMSMVGLDFSEEQKATIRAEADRRGIKAEIQRAKKQLAEIPYHADVPTEEVDTAALLRELTAAQAYNHETSKQGYACKTQETSVRGHAALVERKRAAVVAAELALTKAREEFVESKAKLDTAKNKLGEMQAEFSSRVTKDTASLSEQIETAGAVNAMIAESRTRSFAAERIVKLKANGEKVASRIKDLQRAETDKMNSAPWPVPGLSVSSTGVLYNGLPYEQACTRERTTISTRIGMALNPRLRLLVCDGGSALDNESLDALDALLREHDFQMLLEIVTRSDQDEDRCAVVFSNGVGTAQ